MVYARLETQFATDTQRVSGPLPATQQLRWWVRGCVVEQHAENESDFSDNITPGVLPQKIPRDA
jgi:hypothetical protein